MKLGPVKVVGMGLLTIPLVLLMLAFVLAVGGAFWGWLIMLAWPLFASTTIAFVKAFWIGVIVTVVLGALSN